MNDTEKRRAKRRKQARKQYETWDVGNGMVQATPDAVFRAMGGLPPDLDWEAVAASIIPILPRRRPMPSMAGEPFRVTLPPGIPTGFGIDIGPAFLVVGESLLGTWPVDQAQLVATGMSNLRERAAQLRARDLVTQPLEGVPVRILQSGFGCASALLLVQDELERIFGAERQCFIAPMRDLLISLPADVDRSFAWWLNDEFSRMDPNGLELDAVLLEDGVLRYESLRTAR